MANDFSAQYELFKLANKVKYFLKNQFYTNKLSLMGRLNSSNNLSQKITSNYRLELGLLFLARNDLVILTWFKMHLIS